MMTRALRSLSMDPTHRLRVERFEADVHEERKRMSLSFRNANQHVSPSIRGPAAFLASDLTSVLDELEATRAELVDMAHDNAELEMVLSDRRAEVVTEHAVREAQAVIAVALRARLREIDAELGDDVEQAHWVADQALVFAIGDVEVAEIFDHMHKWYA